MDGRTEVLKVCTMLKGTVIQQGPVPVSFNPQSPDPEYVFFR